MFKIGKTSTPRKLTALILSIILSVINLVIVLPQPVFASQLMWTNIGPEGGKVKAIALSPGYAKDRTIFAGLEGGGIFKSTDGGFSWAKVSNDYQNIYSIAISPHYAPATNYAGDKTVYAATGSRILKSTDRGDTWSEDYIDYNNIYSVAVSPNYIDGPVPAFLNIIDDKTVFVGTSGGVYKSTDGAVSWEKVSNGITRLDIRSVVVSPNYALDHTVIACSSNGDTFISKNGGTSWSSIGTIFFRTVAFSPNYKDDATIFAGAENGNGAYKSTDNGDTWSQIRTGLSIATDDVVSLAISPKYTSDQTLYAGTSSHGIYRSIDGGNNWSHMNLAVSGQVNSFAISPEFFPDSTMFAGTDGGGGSPRCTAARTGGERRQEPAAA